MAQYLNNFVTHVVTIASSGTTSNAVDLQGRAVVQIILPAAFTGTTITFQSSPDNSTFSTLYTTANTQMSMSVTQGRAYAINPADLAGVRYLKLVSGSTEGASRDITIVSRDAA